MCLWQFGHCECNHCGLKFFNYEQIQEHLAKDHEVKNHICQVANRFMEELKKHLQKGHRVPVPERNEVSFKCTSGN